MVKTKDAQRPNPSIRENFFKKISRFFDWIAEGQAAGATCKS
jgi:hypothetical protein